MFISGHIIAGFAIGKFLNNYIIIFIVALFSHYLLDAVPHNEPDSRRGQWINYFDLMIFVAADIVVGLVIGLILIWGKNPWPSLFGALGAILPDVVDNGPWSQYLRTRYSFFRKTYQVHKFFHYNGEGKSRFLGFAQYLVIAGMIWLLLRY